MKTKLIVLAVTFLLLGLFVVVYNNRPTADPDRENNAAVAESSKQTPHLLFEKKNAAFGISALFYGRELRLVGEPPDKIIEYIVLKNEKTGQTATWLPKTDTEQAADFFFTNVWSPDGTYIVLPLDKLDGFAIFNSETVIQDIDSNKFLDTIRVWRGEARRYWHNFDAWDGPAAFYFKGEMEGHTFRFRYDFLTHQLSCYDPGCSRDDHGRNLKGDLAPQGPPN